MLVLLGLHVGTFTLGLAQHLCAERGLLAFMISLYRKVERVFHQTRKTVFDHISKQREESSILDEHRGVWKCGQTLS